MKHCPLEPKVCIPSRASWFATAVLALTLFLPPSYGRADDFAGAGVVELLVLVDELEAEVKSLDDGSRPDRRSFLARLMAIRRLIERLPRSGDREAVLTTIRRRLEDISLQLTTGTPPPRQDEFGVRIEERLGKPVRHPDDGIADEDPWLATSSPRFVNIRKSVFLGKAPGRDLEIVNGIQMTGSFVAARPNTRVGIVFSAEAYVDTPGKRLFVRALVDGTPAGPGDVVFASGTHQGSRAFIFTATVEAGIHTVEMQWLVDRGAMGFIRTASLLIRAGRLLPSAIGTLAVITPSSGPNLETSDAAWKNVPGQSGWVYVPNNGVLTASFSAESFVTGGKALAVRAVVDNALAVPGNVVFARGSAPQSRTTTFGMLGLTPGWHFVRMQWFVEAGGTATMGDRSLLLAAYRSPPGQPTHPFVAPPSGPNVETFVAGFQPVPNLSTTVHIPAKGNGEVAVQFSGEIATDPDRSAFLVLAVDDALQSDTIIELTDGTVAGQVKSFVFAAKHLPAGSHKLELWWAPEPDSIAQMGDRVMAVISETGFIPDLAEQRLFGAGTREKEDNLHGLEPMIGTRDVLLILWDPMRPGHPIGLNSPPGPDFILPPQFTEVITSGQVEQLFFGGDNSVNDYYRAISGEKFGIRNAGVVGWLDALKPPSHYFDAHPDCDASGDGYASGNQERWSEALQSADPFVDFQQFDLDADGVVKPAELAIVAVVPQSTRFGTAHQEVFAQECPERAPLVLDGVRIVEVLEVFLSLDDDVDSLNVAAHELLHQLTGVDDMYDPVPPAVRAGRMSIMAARDSVPHLDPAHKLAFGWVVPEQVETTGFYQLQDVKLNRSVLVLPRYNNNPFGEYFIVENRQDNNQLGPLYDTDINDSGIAVWHIVEDPAENLKMPRGASIADWNATTTTQARRGIRLLRPWQFIDENGALLSGIDPLWSAANYPLLSDQCPILFTPPGVVVPSDNTLSWADCTPSGYNVRFLSFAAPVMTLRIEVE